MNLQDAMKILSPAQFIQVMELIEAQMDLSRMTKCNQTLELVFKDGKMRFLNASQNQSSQIQGVMDSDYTWHDEGK